VDSPARGEGGAEVPRPCHAGRRAHYKNPCINYVSVPSGESQGLVMLDAGRITKILVQIM
jgi:hypothetical protein